MTPEKNPNQVKIRRWSCALFLVLCLLLAGCRTRMLIDTLPNGRDAQIYSSTPTQVEHGIASWYGGRWIGRLTANGETYRAGDLTAAHKKLPFNTRVRVVDLKTGNSLILSINNRGPYVKGRIIDLSVAAAKKLGTYDRGLAKVRIEALREIPLITKSNIRAIHPPKPPTTKQASQTPPTRQKSEILKKN
jgi:rare lipoprotein A (peptidoglycan hydrolase)